jgi:hypothetical protein
MAILNDTLISSSIYSSLPLIEEVQHVPSTNLSDLADLRALLTQHQVPLGISIRLIHKHYDVDDGEVMIFEDVAVPEYGSVKVMHPVKLPIKSSLHGTHFFVDQKGSLQAYEYSRLPAPDLSDYQPFLRDFCRIVVERGLQMKYGLKLQYQPDKTGWMEFEFPSKRSTVMIPDGWPRPEGDLAFQVITEWSGDSQSMKPLSFGCGHNVQSCGHTRKYDSGRDEDLKYYLGPQKIEPGTPVWAILSAVTEVC